MKQNNVFDFLPFKARVGLMTILLTLLTFGTKQEKNSQKSNFKIKEKVSAFNSVSGHVLSGTYVINNLPFVQNNQPINYDNLFATDTNSVPDMNINVEEPTAQELTVKIITGKKMVKYIYSDGRIEVRQGGTLPWRNKNPGALRGASNAIGRANGFAVFASEEDGIESLRTLLHGENYRNLTIKSAIFKYAPPHENDTKRYQANVKKLTGLDLNIKLCDLTEEEMDRVIKTIKRLEGWVPGKLTYIEPQQIQQNQIIDTLQKVR